MNARLERILIKLAQQHAPHLTPPGWEQTNVDERLYKLARQLASYNILVLMGYLHTGMLNDRDSLFQNWVTDYGRLYSLLADNLFPSLTAISAQYADDKTPAIIVVRGDATPVIHVMAGYVSPYIAARQAQRTAVSEAELLGLMDIILDYLEARDLSRERFNTLKIDGVALLKRLLAAPVQQISITRFDRPIVGNMQPTAIPPDELPEEDRPIPPPAPVQEPIKPDPQHELPQIAQEDDPTPTEQLFLTPIPLSGDTGRSTRRLPIPDLPDDDMPDTEKQG